jgi:predicted transcriptional regulator
MTPEDYRERWGLASDYPMVAPNYAKQRSKLAKEIGLGTRARKTAAG